jgi:hypothetical protein
VVLPRIPDGVDSGMATSKTPSTAAQIKFSLSTNPTNAAPDKLVLHHFIPLAPTVNGSNPSETKWLNTFLNDSCKNCQVDFVNIHWYGETNSQDFKNWVVMIEGLIGSQRIWITEVSCSSTLHFLKTGMKC